MQRARSCGPMTVVLIEVGAVIGTDHGDDPIGSRASTGTALRRPLAPSRWTSTEMAMTVGRRRASPRHKQGRSQRELRQAGRSEAQSSDPNDRWPGAVPLRGTSRGDPNGN